MKKILSIIVALELLLASIVIAQSDDCVFNFSEANDDVILSDAAIGAELSWSEVNGCLVLNPNYVSNPYICIKSKDFDIKDKEFIKVRYFFSRAFNANTNATYKKGNKDVNLYSLSDKSYGIWYEEVVEISKVSSNEFVFAPISSTDDWTCDAGIYIDYIGFFDSEKAANEYRESDDTSEAPEIAAANIDEQEFVNATKKQYIEGYVQRLFKPDKVITNAEAATIISRITEGSAGDEEFKIEDVNETDWYYSGIKKLALNNVIENSGMFYQDEGFTRRNFARILKKIVVAPKNIAITLNDISQDDTDYDVIYAIAKSGIMIGDENGNFMPDSFVTRAQMVAAINRLLNIDLNEVDVSYCPYEDVSQDHWAYRDILAASVSGMNNISSSTGTPVATMQTIDGIQYDVYNSRNKVWEPVPLVSQKQLDLGMTGGEGGQVTTYITVDKTGDFLLAFHDIGGIFRSLDGGKSWERCGRGVNHAALTTGEIDPNNPDRCIAVTHKGSPGRVLSKNYQGAGIYLSTDKGYSFKSVMPITDDETGWRVAFAYDPTSYDEKIGGSSIIYYTTHSRSIQDNNYGAAVKKEIENGLNEGYGLYRSTDGGESWKLISKDYGNAPVAVCHKDGSVFVANENGLFRSEDKGETFNKVVSGRVTSVTCIAAKPENVYINDNTGILISTDCGKSFNRISGSNFPGDNTDNLKVSEADPNRMMISYTPANVNEIGAFWSHDGGKSWTKMNYDRSYDFYEVQFRKKVTAWSPKDENKVWTTYDWVASSEDGGKTFHWNDNGNCGSCFNSWFTPNVYNSDWFLAPAQDFLGGITYDGGKTFKSLHTDYPMLMRTGNHNYGGYVVDENTFFYLNHNTWEPRSCDLYITYDGGKSFAKAAETSCEYRHNFCFQSPVDENVLFAGDLRSDDKGKTWKKISNNIWGVAAFNPNGKELFGNKESEPKSIYISTDTGITWQKYCEAEIVYGEDAYSYVLVMAYDGKNDILYFAQADKICKYQNGKFTYIECDLHKDRWITALCVDPIHPNVIYASAIPNGVEPFQTVDFRYSITRSCDGGETWQLISTGEADETIVKDGPVSGSYNSWAMWVNPKDGYLFAAQPCYGLYKFAPPYDME